MFKDLLLKLIPLYLMIFLGYISAKKLSAQKETIAKLLIYIIAPVIIFFGALKVEINFANMSFPFLFYFVCCFICILFYFIGKFFYKTDSTKNILAFTSGTGNTGYFGLPVIGILFGDQAFNLAIIMILGTILYENTLGFFITAKGNHTIEESLIKVVKLPGLYAFALGIILNLLHLEPNEIILSTIQQFKGAYTLLGMMMIGMGLSTINGFSFDLKFISLAFLAKFIVWPLIIFGLVFLDKSFFHIYNSMIHKIFLLMSIVPLAANTVAFATELHCHPEKAALTVLLGTLFALFYIPLMVSIFILKF